MRGVAITSMRYIFAMIAMIVTLLQCACHSMQVNDNNHQNTHVSASDSALTGVKRKSQWVYKCRVLNLHSKTVYLGYDRRRNVAISQAREACYAGAHSASCDFHLDCQLQHELP